MEIRKDPYFLEIKDKDITLCPRCNYLLNKEIKKGKCLINECGYCRYSDRPFVCMSSSWQQHFPDGCTCVYEEQDILFVSCVNCLNPKCIKCNNSIVISCDIDLTKTICLSCENKIKKQEFNNNWKKSSLEEKLNFYGIEKLKKLAKNKNIKGFSKLNKQELKEKLCPIINDKDFPIK